MFFYAGYSHQSVFVDVGKQRSHTHTKKKIQITHKKNNKKNKKYRSHTAEAKITHIKQARASEGHTHTGKDMK